MKIVIDIDDNLYTRLFDNGETDAVDMLKACIAIRKGDVLPKGHDALLDAGQLMNYCQNQIEGHKYVDCNVIARFPCVVKADKEEAKPSMQEPWKEVQPPCFDNCCCGFYEIGEGGCAICVFDAERIVEGEPCHRYKTRGR